MAIRVTVRGPLFSGNVRSVVQAEFASANDTAASLLTTEASAWVNRAFGNYERGWRRQPTIFGKRIIVKDQVNNPLVHAAVHETGRAPRRGRPGGVRNLMAWIVLRGIVPNHGSVLGFAIAISRKHFRDGWPNDTTRANAFNANLAPGLPPRPVERAMLAEATPVVNAYQQAARRIARRLS